MMNQLVNVWHMAINVGASSRALSRPYSPFPDTNVGVLSLLRWKFHSNKFAHDFLTSCICRSHFPCSFLNNNGWDHAHTVAFMMVRARHKKREWQEHFYYLLSKDSYFIEWMKLNRCKRHLADAPGDKRQWMEKR